MSLQTHAVWLAAPARKRNRRNEEVCKGEHAPFPIQLSMTMAAVLRWLRSDLPLQSPSSPLRKTAGAGKNR